MIVHSRNMAWTEVGNLFPYDFEKDEQASQNAGYNIFRSTKEGHPDNWISDLGDRLEINLEDGKSINIWIMVESGPTVKVTLKDGHTVTYAKEENVTVHFADNGHIKFYNITSANGFTSSYRVDQIGSITINY